MGTSPTRRPFRWPKFAATTALAALGLAAALPRLRIYAALLRGPYVEAPELPAPGWIALGALALIALGWSIADAAFDRRMPRSLVAALVLALGAIGPARVLFPGAPAVLRPDGKTLVAKLLAAARRHAQQQLERTGAIPTAGWEELAAAVPASWRGRDLELVPPAVRVVREAPGPLLVPPLDATPGTVLLAIAPEGKVGWLTAVVSEDGRPTVLQEAGAAVVLGIARGLGSEGGT